MLDILKNAGYRKFLIDLIARKRKHPYVEGVGESNYPVVRFPVQQNNPLTITNSPYVEQVMVAHLEVTPQCLLEAVCGLIEELQNRDNALERIVNLALQSQHNSEAMHSLMSIATAYRDRNYGRR